MPESSETNGSREPGDAGEQGDTGEASGSGDASDSGEATDPGPGTGERPVLVFDDDCGFCTWCANFGARHGDVEVVGFTELTPAQRERLPEDWRECAHFLTADAVYSCGASVERTLEYDFPLLAPAFGVLRRVPGYAWLREKLYRLGADRRDLLGRVVRDEPPARSED